MEKKPEQKIGLGMEKMAERELLSQPFSRYLMEDWCRINSYIELDVLERPQWEKEYKEQPLSLKDEKKVLHVPRDMKFYEMPKITGKVALDVYEGDPEMQEQWQEQVREYGENFRNAGVYIAKRAENIGNGRGMAEKTAEEFFEYGQKALGEEMVRPLSAEDNNEWLKIIAEIPLSDQETKHLDKWLAGEDLYKKRTAAIEVLPKELQEEALEVKRLETLAQYFHLAEKGGRQNSERINSKEAPSVAQRFYAKAQGNLGREVERAYQDLEIAIQEGGYKGLLKKELAGIGGNNSETANVLEYYFERRAPIEELVDVKNFRERIKQDLKRSSFPEDIAGADELDFASNIKKLIGTLDFEPQSDTPQKISELRAQNCLGKTALFGQIMKEAGIDNALVHIPGHVLSIISTKEGRVWLVENTDTSLPSQLSGGRIFGTKPDGSKVELQDIINIASGKSKQGVSFRYGQEFLHVAPAENSLLSAVANNVAVEYLSIDTTRALALRKRASDADPSDPVLAARLIVGTNDYESPDKAREMLDSALIKFGKDPQANSIFAQVADSFGQTVRAKEILEKSLEADPDNYRAVLLAANASEKSGDIASAKKYYDDVLHAGTIFSEDIYKKVADFFLKEGDADKAKIGIDLAISVSKDKSKNAQYRAFLAKIEALKGNALGENLQKGRAVWEVAKEKLSDGINLRNIQSAAAELGKIWPAPKNEQQINE
ncbi:MAG: tetratricopeptide repeat protein [Candidatus Paceibacterota bacterium]